MFPLERPKNIYLDTITTSSNGARMGAFCPDTRETDLVNVKRWSQILLHWKQNKKLEKVGNGYS
jgi:hypothetical protein